ncbi:centromere protein F-like [Narcine bancroftii]|uniref:centromere protein F-like n=1 Tax=Narcine bancroftii TaxID=1343680 RepID=UPI003831ED97
MSWALEEWKSGLSSQAMQKILEYESQLEKLKKERQQKQLQLDSLEIAFQKQTQKLEGEKNENASLKRKTQNLTDMCNDAEKAQKRLYHEIQAKEALVCNLEGQLLAAKKQVDKLEQDIKRLEAELERSQRASTVMECHPTPTKCYPGVTVHIRAVEVSKWDELQEKYDREVEEKKRLVTEVKALKLQVQLLQCSSNKSHRERAPQNIRASTFTWQPETAPAHPVENTVRHGSSPSAFPWDHSRTPPCHSSRFVPQNQTSNLGLDSKNDHLKGSDSVQEQELRKENQVLKCTISELEVWVQSQEKEVKNHLNNLQECQSLLEKSRGELAMKEQALTKCRDDLERAVEQQEQTRNKCAILEQKLKQVSEELNCQRQNSESVRRTMEQKSKHREKEYQQELSDQQRAYRSLEHQCKQEKNQLNQEIQQLKAEHLALHAKINKMTAGKQLVDRELEEVKAKCYWAEKELATHQKNGDDLQKNLQCALKEKEHFSIGQEQSSHKILQLEIQLKRLEQQLTQSQRSSDEMKAENLDLASKLKDLQMKLDPQKERSSESTDPSLTLCELNESGGMEVGRSCPNEEPDTHHRSDGESEIVETVLGLQVEARENKLGLMEGSQLGELEQVAKSANLNPGSGDDVDEEHISNTEVKQRVELVESQISEKAMDAFLISEEEMGIRLPVFKEEAKKESEADSMVLLRDPEEKNEGVDHPDKPISVSANLRELESKLEDVEIKNQVLESELENVKRELESRMIEGRKDRQTIAELRRKLKQVTKRLSTEAESSSGLVALHTGRISSLEQELEQERVRVVNLQEANKLLEVECRKVSQLSKAKTDHVGSNSELQILQKAASRKMQQLEREIAYLKDEKSCIEELIRAHRETFSEGSGALHKEAWNLEAIQIPSGLCCESGEKLEHKPTEEKITEMKGGEGVGNASNSQELFLEYQNHKVLRQSELNEHQKHLTKLQQKCIELTREKEEEGEARRQVQEMFENLQSRIHRETQQLTVALETQGKNIEGLLLSMEEKDDTIRVLNGHLQSSLKVLSCLYQENRELKANLKSVLGAPQERCTSPSKGAVPEQDCGQVAQANHGEREEGSPPSEERSGLRRPAFLMPIADENTRKSEPVALQEFDQSLLRFWKQVVGVIPSHHDLCEEAKIPLLSSTALQHLSEMKKLVENQQLIKDSKAIYSKKTFTDESVVAKVQEAGSSLSTEAPQGNLELASTLNLTCHTVAQTNQDIGNQWKLGCGGSEGSDAMQSRLQIRSSEGPQVQVDKLEGSWPILQAAVAQNETETQAKQRAVVSVDSQTSIPALVEKKSVEMVIKEADQRLSGDLKHEDVDKNELSQGQDRTLIAQFNVLNERCTILEQEREQLKLEAQSMQKAASDLQCEKESLETAIQSSESLLRMRTDERDRLHEELEVLKSWRMKVLADAATFEAQKESGQVKLQSLRRTVLELQNHAKMLEGERDALKDAVENANCSEKHLKWELEQVHSAKSELQNQVENLQRAAAELNEEKIHLKNILKQWASPSEDEEIPVDYLQMNGLYDDLDSTATAQITASKMRAGLEALKQAVREKSEEVNWNLSNCANFPSEHQEREMAKKVWSAIADLPRGEAEPGNQGSAADCESQALTHAGLAVSAQQAIDLSAEEVQTKISQRSSYPESSGTTNLAEIAMKINPAELAARIRRNRQFRHHLSVAFDETEYEPYGLPDVVQKGFADIPSGSFCPHILRRGTLNSPFCPPQEEHCD